MVKSFLSVLGFLTILPVGNKRMLTENEMGRFSSFFPLVGLAIGLFLFLFNYLFLTDVPPRLAAVCIVVLLIIITRGFHLDAIADTADALLSHKDREKKLEILKDSHQGTFGVIAIVLSVFIKIELLSYILNSNLNVSYILILFPIWGRFAASWVAVKSVYVGALNGLAYGIVEKSEVKDLYWAFFCLILISIVAGANAFICSLIITILAWVLTFVWRKALGGITGDLLGATVEFAEIASLIIILMLI